MNKILLTLLLACVHLLFVHAQEDSLKANRYVMRATLYGVGHTNILDTYLSPMEYTGPELRFLRESMRMYVTEHVWERITVERMNVVYALGERISN